MITEDYVSFEVAKLLKEKGFNKDAYTMSMYDENGEAKDALLLKVGEEPVLRPTLQMPIKWLGEVHNLAIATYLKADGWHSGVSQIKFGSEGFIVDIIDGIDDGNIPNCDTYEEACEAAIKYCHEHNLI